jgi:NAD(P)-dependent dehydrogenase (short-subunit alcohol dehydrogenase family)
MTLSGSTVLITGANGGIGRAYVEALLARGAAKIYVAARDTVSLRDLLAGGDPRLSPLPLDITDPDQVAAAAGIARDVTLLINNAGYAAFEGAIAAPDMDDARREMEVNYFGTLAMTRAFAPILAQTGKGGGGGTVVNMLSMLALVSLPMAATYAASKAAGLSLTRSLRAELAAQKTQVIGVLAVRLPPPHHTAARATTASPSMIRSSTSPNTGPAQRRVTRALSGSMAATVTRATVMTTSPMRTGLWKARVWDR